MIFIMSSCSIVKGNDDDRVVERKLESSIGQLYSSSDWSRSSGAVVQRLAEDGGKKQFRYTWKNGCSIVLSVEVSTDVIKSWRYSSDVALCRSIHEYTFGT